MAKIAACIGGGVIGGGWVARFLLHGWDVNVFDPAPDAARKITEVLDNARRALPKLFDVTMPAEGTLTFCDSLSAAVSDAQWIQESVPETLTIKHKVLCEIQTHCTLNAIVASSTSGFKPTELQQNVLRPQQIIVAHPFNPVYLVPLVELVPSEACDSSIVSLAKEILTAIGMKPLLVRKEIEAHIADRLLEAVWREGLWLVKDDIATTEEIDDAIRFGFGLRWAQMGLFETYRIAGGEAGMAHFIAQFGPALAWPWTKLMDVPELTDELIQKIADQSDAQSGDYSIRELERIRDENLVGIMRTQKDTNWGVGVMLKQHDQRLTSLSSKTSSNLESDSRLALFEDDVAATWLDEYQYLTDKKLQQVISEVNDKYFTLINHDANHAYMTEEARSRRFAVELKLSDKMQVETTLLKSNSNTIELFHRFSLISCQTLLATVRVVLKLFKSR